MVVETQRKLNWGDHPCPELQDSRQLNPWKSHRTNAQRLQQNPDAFVLYSRFAATASAFRGGPEAVADLDVNVLMVPSRGTWVQHTAPCQQPPHK